MTPDDVSLREYLEVLIDAARGEARAAIDASNHAVEKAERASDRRFESVNEFRAQLADQQDRFMLREVSDARYQALAKKVDALQTQQDRTRGADARNTDMRAQFGLMLLAASVVISLVVLLANGSLS